MKVSTHCSGRPLLIPCGLLAIFALFVTAGCEPKLNSTDPSERIRAVQNLTDQTILAKVAIEDTDPRIRNAAVSMLMEQIFLAKVAIEAKDRDVRHTAVGKLVNQEILAKVAFEDPDLSVSSAAFQKLTNPNPALLAKVAHRLDSSELLVFKTKWELSTAKSLRSANEGNLPKSEWLTAVAGDTNQAFAMSAGENEWAFFDPHTGKAKEGIPPLSGLALSFGGRTLVNFKGFFSEDGNQFYTLSDGDLRARDIKTGHELFRINTEPAKHGIPLGNESSVVARIYDVCPLNSHEIAIIKHVGNYNQHSFLAVLDKDTGKETRRLDLDPNNLRGMHSTNYSHLFTAPTAHLVAVSMPTYHGPIIVSIYREQTLELMRTVTIQESDLDPTPYDYMQTDLKLSNDGRFFAVTCDSGHQDPILIYDTESGKRVGYYFGGNESYRSAVTFSPDGMFLIVASEINDVRSSTGFTSTSRLGLRLDIYDWANGRLSAQIKPDNSWDNFSSVIMLPSWEILAQLGDRILCFSLVTPH